MSIIFLYIFLCFTTTFTGSYISISDNLSGLSEEQIEQIVQEIEQESK